MVDTKTGELENAAAFEFLLENSDAIEINTATSGNWIPRSGRIEVFDHDKAFNPWIEDIPKSTFETTSLPDKYTRGFISSLNKLTPEIIIENFSSLLTSLEIQALFIRRLIILKDVQLRNGPFID